MRSGEEGSWPGSPPGRSCRLRQVGVARWRSSSVLRGGKDGHTCTCLGTLLLISSRVDMAGNLGGRRPCLTHPMVPSDATLSSDGV